MIKEENMKINMWDIKGSCPICQEVIYGGEKTKIVSKRRLQKVFDIQTKEDLILVHLHCLDAVNLF